MSFGVNAHFVYWLHVKYNYLHIFFFSHIIQTYEKEYYLFWSRSYIEPLRPLRVKDSTSIANTSHIWSTSVWVEKPRISNTNHMCKCSYTHACIRCIKKGQELLCLYAVIRPLGRCKRNKLFKKKCNKFFEDVLFWEWHETPPIRP